jgi:hypothetical protein
MKTAVREFSESEEIRLTVVATLTMLNAGHFDLALTMAQAASIMHRTEDRLTEGKEHGAFILQRVNGKLTLYKVDQSVS